MKPVTEEGKLPVPALYSVWKHQDGDLYRVMAVSNEAATSADWPVTVVYQSLTTSLVWSRPLTEWVKKFTPAPQTKVEGKEFP